MRIEKHPILDFKKGNPVHFQFNGQRIKGYEGDTIASALYAAGFKTFSKSIKYARPRGFFCAIGKCSSCLMSVDGIPNVRICITPVKEGILVEIQDQKAELPSVTEAKAEKETVDTDLAVVGAGPAGLAAAISASELGTDVVVIDENPLIGGQLIKQTHKFFGSKDSYAGARGIEIANILMKGLKATKAKWILNSSVVGCYENKTHLIEVVQNNRKLIEVKAKNVIVATGAMENMLAFPNNDLPGVMGAGGVQTLMNVYGIKPGKNVLMIGSGNVGLIVGYQLLQAGVNVEAVVEALPQIGGYFVHAAKLRRMGVPILTSHSIKEAIGTDHVKGAVIVELDKNWQPVPGSEQKIDVDVICLAVGLSPSSELLFQAGCKEAYISELGGRVAVHDQSLETSIDGIYVAGDVSGIEEASTAMVEGRIAGADVAEKLGMKKAEEIRKNSLRQLELLRESPFSKKVKAGKEKVWALAEDIK